MRALLTAALLLVAAPADAGRSEQIFNFVVNGNAESGEVAPWTGSGRSEPDSHS